MRRAGLGAGPRVRLAVPCGAGPRACASQRPATSSDGGPGDARASRSIEMFGTVLALRCDCSARHASWPRPPPRCVSRQDAMAPERASARSWPERGVASMANAQRACRLARRRHIATAIRPERGPNAPRSTCYVHATKANRRQRARTHRLDCEPRENARFHGPSSTQWVTYRSSMHSRGAWTRWACPSHRASSKPSAPP